MVQTLLLHADSVIVVRDNERTAQKQAKTDAAHDRQIARIQELRGNCGDWRPPVGVKDVADLNQRERAVQVLVAGVRLFARRKPTQGGRR